MKFILLFSFFLSNLPLQAQEDLPIIIDLEGAQARAENNSPELRAFNLQMLAENYAYSLGVRIFFPTLSVGFSQSDSVTLNAPNDTTKKTVSLSIHQPLFDGGRTLFQRKVQKLNLTLSQYLYMKKREELLQQTWRLFYQIVLLAEKSRLQDELHNIALQQLTISKTERQLGTIREIDYIDTEIEVKKLEAEMRKTKMEAEVLLYQMQMLCELPRSTPIELDGRIDFSYGGISLRPEPEFWLAIALEQNLDYRKIQFESEKSKEEFRIAETTYVPTIGADFTFSLSGERFPLYEPGFTFKLTFQFPFNEIPTKVNLDATTNFLDQRTMATGFTSDLFPSLNFIADKRLALVKLQMMSSQLETTREDLRFNIEQFLKNYAFEVENLDLRKQTIKLFERKLRVYRAQLGIGEIKRIDYLKAQNDYYQEEIGIRENILSIIEMERSFEQLLGLQPGELKKIVEDRN